ncbi:MAG: hypothetical protein IT257_05315 [Chitinophagaceae bacterium]|nr:hypothetical protein [Chitinophagaceae bacterium]
MYPEPEDNVKVMMNKWILLLLLCINAESMLAQKLVTSLLPLKDSTIAQFKDINELYFLHQASNKKLQKLVQRLTSTTSQQKADAILKDIAKLRTEGSVVILGLDYYFKNSKPVAGSNVAHVLDLLANSPCYQLINQYWYQNSIDTNLPGNAFKQKMQDTIGWIYGFGAFYYLSPADSSYIIRMKKVNTDEIDAEIEEIIEGYLSQQSNPFKYEFTAMVNDIKQVKNVVDVQHDACLIKTQQLPNWDQIGVLIVKGKDTVERVYTIQYGRFSMFRLGKHVSFPLISKPDVLFYKGVGYGLHFIRNTRVQCEQNKINHLNGMQ